MVAPEIYPVLRLRASRHNGSLAAYTTKSENWLRQVVELSLGHYTDNRGQTPEEKETVVLKPISVLQPSADNGGTKSAIALPSRRDELDDDVPFE